MGTEPKPLNQAIEHLYDVFEGYRPQGPIYGCPCCVAENDSERLHSKPLREVDLEVLRRYIPNAMTTWGTEDDFKYLVPRLLEGLADQSDYDFRFNLILKFKSAGWPSWPRRECRAVEDFLRAWWRSMLGRYEEVSRGQWSGGVLEIISGLSDVGPCLEEWTRSGSVAALRHLAQFIYSSLLVRSDGTVVICSEINDPRISQWMLEPETLKRLESGLLDHPEAEWTPYVAETAGYLRQVRR